MAKLIHEVWEEAGDGEPLHTCCFAGPRGDGCRRALSRGAKLLTTFEAGSHFEAMTAYYRLLGRAEYTTDQPQDHEPYPTEWLAEQQGFS